MSKLLGLIFVFTVIASNAFAFPLPTPEQAAEANAITLRGKNIFSDLESRGYNFEGIVKLSNCSGSLVRYTTSKENDLALVLTNGHCLDLGGFLKPGEVVYNKPIRRQFGLYNADAQIVGTLNATHIVYGTMTNTDMALYRLDKTYAEIYDAHKVRPLVLSEEKTTLGTPIEIISGYWKRGYACTVDKFVTKLMEAGWSFYDSIRYSEPGCDTIGGTSGSPIINPLTREVVGVNNTGNEDGEECTMNNPCEIEDGKTTVVPGASYGQQTFWVYGCLTENNEINLFKESCTLPH